MEDRRRAARLLEELHRKFSNCDRWMDGLEASDNNIKGKQLYSSISYPYHSQGYMTGREGGKEGEKINLWVK